MHRSNLFLIILLFQALRTPAQPAFQRTYAMGSQNLGRSAVIAANHDLYFLGTTNENNFSQTNVYLVCTDSAGNYRWQRSYGGGGVEQGMGISLLPDQSLMIGGYSNSFNFTSDYDGYLLRVNAAGDTLWTRHVGSNAWDFLTTQAQGLGDTVLFAGYTYGNGSSTAAPWIVKVLPDGTVASSTVLPVAGECFVKNIKVLPDGRILLGGFFGTGPNQPTDAWIGLCDASLDTVWNRRVDVGHAESINALDIFPNGDVLFAGQLTLSTNGFEQNMIGRMDATGSLAWFNSAGGDSTYDAINDVFIRNDTVFCGATTSTFGQGARDFQLITFDGNGQFIVGKTYGGPEGEQVHRCIPGDFGGVILTGYSYSFPVDQQTLFVVRTDSALESTNATVIGLPARPNVTWTVFPNPLQSGNRLRIRASVPVRAATITDLSGRVLLQLTPGSSETESPEINLPAGVYFLNCLFENGAILLRKIAVTGTH